MNIINYVISFTGVIRATMDIFSSDASWIVETEGDITEKTDATHSTGSHVFFKSSSFSVQIQFCGWCWIIRFIQLWLLCQVFFHLQELPLHTNLTYAFAQSTSPFFPHVRATLVCIFSVHHQLPPLLAQASSQLHAGQSFFRGKYNNSNNNNNRNNNSKITIMIQNV